MSPGRKAREHANKPSPVRGSTHAGCSLVTLGLRPLVYDGRLLMKTARAPPPVRHPFAKRRASSKIFTNIARVNFPVFVFWFEG